jgi:hypothetical protein
LAVVGITRSSNNTGAGTHSTRALKAKEIGEEVDGRVKKEKSI